MNKRGLAFGALALVFAATANSPARGISPAQEKKDSKPAPAKPEKQETGKPDQKPAPAGDKPDGGKTDAGKTDKNSIDAFAEWAKSIEPAAHHKHLEPLAGKWNLAIKYLDDDGKTADSAGTSEFKWALGKRFLIEETHATVDGQPFDWFGWHGYDNVSQKHVADFIDNFGTNIDRMEGTCEHDCKEIAYAGKEPMIGGGEMKMRWVLKIDGPDKFITEMYADHGEGEKKMMEMTATRAK